MNSQRLGVAIGVLDGCLYAVGGSDGVSPLSTVERSLIYYFKIIFIISLLSIIIIIYYYYYYYYYYLIRYDPKSDKWANVSPMQVKRKHLGVAVIDNVLYAVGGRDDTFELSSVERY